LITNQNEDTETSQTVQLIKDTVAPARLITSPSRAAWYNPQ
jgi:hypothetical protein